MKNILIVEDNWKELKKIQTNLKSNDVNIYHADNISMALKFLRNKIIDVLVLDRKLIIKNFENEDGLTICQYIKQNPKKYRNPFIIVLSKLGSYEDKKEGFFAGVNSYFDKKYEFELCISAIKTRLKTKIFSDGIIKYGNLILDIGEGSLEIKNKDYLKINNTEYVLLLELLKHQEIWLHKEELKKICWGENNHVTDNFLFASLSRLRTKVKTIDDNLISKRFRGYFLKTLD